jgi:signal transduction histidine kinase
MTNVIDFPRNASSSKSSAHRHVAALLSEPERHTHAVQFYEDDEFLFDTVGRFLAAGLDAGDRLLVIATPEHRRGFKRRLPAQRVDQAIESGQLMMLDARQTLEKFMVRGMPDADLFRDVLARLVAQSEQHRPEARLRAYGEMVDLLWRDGNSCAAIRLEELWNDAGQAREFSLLCAYVMGNFYKEGDQARFMEVCRNHSHVIPTEHFLELGDADARLREISLLQQRARALEHEIAHRAELERALRDALRERAKIEEDLRASVKCEAIARGRAEASDAFKQMFLGILGHDLRNPLSTIMTTAQMMAMRDVPADDGKKLRRIISSGERMRRMVDQILDVTRAKLFSGLSVERKADQDMVALVARIVEEVRAARPEREIEFEIGDAVAVSIDCDRFEQVVSNLLGNAVAHGDPARPIRVALHKRGRVTVLSVHNHGTPIDPEFMPLLFDAFKRAGKPRGRSDGLGLGLYISQCIVAAHGGKIEVASSSELGTRFDVILPES